MEFKKTNLDNDNIQFETQFLQLINYKGLLSNLHLVDKRDCNSLHHHPGLCRPTMMLREWMNI